MNSPKELKEKIMEYCLDEGILGKKAPENPKVDFAFELKFPPNSQRPMKMMLIKPKEKKAILIQIATQIAKKHVKALNKQDAQGVLKFFYHLKKYLLVQNLSYNIDAKNARYVISEVIYPDGLNEHLFYKTLRKIFNTSLYVNMMLTEMISGKRLGKEGGTGTMGEDFDFSGGSMYS